MQELWEYQKVSPFLKEIERVRQDEGHKGADNRDIHFRLGDLG